ncbi:hypothetical protein LUZ61_016288 [Rhynchospora tenuis]|uniref:Purple acid phosphatase n=1 Tax=Rhynchospora tenuis TaxID=198213 RepID=A0AAD6EJY6_9POAL|nr:hypothetical protein LUZ61_016288 [Rhynchospora tenuis]
MILVVGLTIQCNGGVTSTYRRRMAASDDMPLNADVFQPPPGYNAPQQVHITQGDYDGSAVIVAWVTPSEVGSNTVRYGTSNTTLDMSAEGTVSQYKYFTYTSGYIHQCTLKGLQFGTTYYYSVEANGTARTFSFKTPPQPGPDSSYTFGIIGDLGQTFDSNSTLTHYKANTNAAALLYVGDFSYADNYPNHDNVRWDTWGRFTESSVAYQPWIWTFGNHELDFAPEIGETTPFKPVSNRYPTPYSASGSTEQYYYAVRRASAHIIVLASYSAYGSSNPQYKWLQTELKKVDRTVTPWLIVLIHAPWYNSYKSHYMEGETVRVQFEAMMVKYKVDVVFAGHVHAYERSHRISNIGYNITNANCSPVSNNNAPVYITVGDGGNMEGLSTE